MENRVLNRAWLILSALVMVTSVASSAGQWRVLIRNPAVPIVLTLIQRWSIAALGLVLSLTLMDNRKRKRLSYNQGYGKTTISTDR
jgi:hypothetical protein